MTAQDKELVYPSYISVKIKSILQFYKEIGIDASYKMSPCNFLYYALFKILESGGKGISRELLSEINSAIDNWMQTPFDFSDNPEESEWQQKFAADKTMQERAQLVMDCKAARQIAKWRSNGDLFSFLYNSVPQVALWHESGKISKHTYETCVADAKSDRIVAYIDREPKYNLGDLVMLRAGVLREITTQLRGIGWGTPECPPHDYQILGKNWELFQSGADRLTNESVFGEDAGWILRDLEDKGVPMVGMVTEIDPVPSYTNAKTSRTYRIVTTDELFNAAPVLILEERWLKKAPKKM